MTSMKVFVICFVMAFSTSGCLVTKEVYTELLAQKKESDVELQKLRREQADKDKRMSELKIRIASLMQEKMALQDKHELEAKAAKEVQEVFRKKYDTCEKIRLEKIKFEKIDALKEQPQESLPSEQKSAMEELYYQLEHQLKEALEKGQIKLKLHKKKIQ